MEDLPIGAEVTLKVVEAENCDGCLRKRQEDRRSTIYIHH